MWHATGRFDFIGPAAATSPSEANLDMFQISFRRHGDVSANITGSCTSSVMVFIFARLNSPPLSCFVSSLPAPWQI